MFLFVWWVGVQCVSSENLGVEGQCADVEEGLGHNVSICIIWGGGELGEIYTKNSP